ncbi:MAG: nucleotidyltransferase domain-containing protein [Candidatus Desantisbacteria bacterium]
MVSTSDLKVIQEWAQRYNIRSVYLFGSSLSGSSEVSDIDLGIEGIPRERFFELTGRLDWALSKSVDVVDLDSNNPFAPIIRKYGKHIYG